MLSKHYFGDVEAIDEGKNHKEYFLTTYETPSSISLDTLNNRRKFIIVGRKGVGKTAAQFHFSSKLEQDGYLTHFFSFHNDVKPKDYNDAVKTQRIDLLGYDNSKNIFLNYDFRDIWLRTFLLKIAETLHKNEIQSAFTKFALAGSPKLASLFEGIQKSLTVKISAEFIGIAAEVGIDSNQLNNGELELAKFTVLLKELIKKHHRNHRMYLFVDELVMSRLDASDDEINVRAAMVRDIFRCARDLNNFFAENNLDFHIICSLRPEIRNMINERDSEIGKIFDGKTVTLEWHGREDTNALMNILRNKIAYSLGVHQIVDFENFICKSIHFGGRSISILEFLITNAWARPRDIVQILNTVADKNPNSSHITENELKSSLFEYSRKSFYELMEELSVNHGAGLSSVLMKNIKKREYTDFNEFNSQVLKSSNSHNKLTIADDLFNSGFIGNVDKSKNPPRFYWAHRGDTHINESAQIQVHSGLWHFLRLQ